MAMWEQWKRKDAAKSLGELRDHTEVLCTALENPVGLN